MSSISCEAYSILGPLPAGVGENSHRENFRNIEESLRTLGCSPEMVQTLWRLLAAILEIGNIEFADEDTPEGAVARILNMNQIQLVSELLSLSPEDLVSLFTKRNMQTRGETYSISLKAKEAVNARNAICKALYSTQFDSIVTLINAALNDGNCLSIANIVSIGVLDIFGFESFKTNSFEQVRLPPHTIDMVFFLNYLKCLSFLFFCPAAH
jgi:myosin III